MNKKCFIYARKSSESDDRQALSIGSQIDELKPLARRLGYEVLKIYKESFSAKKPGRLIFNQMVEEVEAGEVKTIFVWNPDRLSRNSIDTGKLIYLFDLGELEEIIIPSRVFKNTPDDKFMLNILWGQSKLENDNKSLNVKRGLKRKAKLGWYPTVAPIGYLNTPNAGKGYKTIKKDPKRFGLIRRMWSLILSSQYLPPEITKIANEEWGLRTRKFRRQGGKKLSKSLVYRIFHNPFYYGEYEWPVGSGNWYKGKHSPMVSKSEFEKVQLILGSRSNIRPQKNNFPFTGIIRCGECGCMITAETKLKSYKKTGNVRRYTYYRCTKKNLEKRCLQPYLRKEELESQISTILSQITIPESFRNWAVEQLKKEHKRESKERGLIGRNLQESVEQVEKKLDNLLDLKLAEQINKEEYQQKKRELLKEKGVLTEKLNDKESYSAKWREGAEETFDFACNARYWFENGTIKEKRKILSCLGSNFILKDKKLRFSLEKPFVLIKKANKTMLKKSTSLGLRKDVDKLAKLDDLDPNNPTWLLG